LKLSDQIALIDPTPTPSDNSADTHRRDSQSQLDIDGARLIRCSVEGSTHTRSQCSGLSTRWLRHWTLVCAIAIVVRSDLSYIATVRRTSLVLILQYWSWRRSRRRL